MNERVRIHVRDVFEYGRHMGSDQFVFVVGAGPKRVFIAYGPRGFPASRGWVTRSVARSNVRDGFWRRYNRRTGILDGGPFWRPKYIGQLAELGARALKPTERPDRDE